MKEYYSIGEFSRITGLSAKALRFYHEKGILVPSSVDAQSGYRYYDSDKIEKARVIMRLRAMEFSIEDIIAIFSQCDDDANVLGYLEQQKEFLQSRMAEDREIVHSLSQIILKEKAASQLLESAQFKIEEKTSAAMLVAGVRMKGRYSDCGAGFQKLGQAAGRHICGKALCLYYDDEYREEDADFEPCLPIRRRIETEGIHVHELPSARVLTLVHRGPYDQLGRSYAKILRQASQQQLKIVRPTREVYVKGPGMIFKGNPKNYLTEIQLPIGD